MRALDAYYPGFELAVHKGYATAAHLAALGARAASPLHRRSFEPGARQALAPPGSELRPRHEHRASFTCGCTPSTRSVDSVVRVPELVAAVAAAGMPAVAVTDQNNLFAMVKFYREALERGHQAHRSASICWCARRASARARRG